MNMTYSVGDDNVVVKVMMRMRVVVDDDVLMMF